MKKNLLFFNLDILDKARDKFIEPIMRKLDEGSIFKSFVILLLYIGAFAALLGGIALTVKGMIGEHTFITKHISSELAAGAHRNGAIVGLAVGALLSLITAWVLYAIIMKRTTQLKSEHYEGLLHFLYAKTVPKMIILAGEVVCTLMIYAALLSLVAAAVGSAAYGPLGGFKHMIMAHFPGMEYLPSHKLHFVGDYDNLAHGIKVGVLGLFFAFMTLIAFYIYREVYNYIVKLVVILIAYIPKFAIPLSIRSRNEGH